MTFPLPIAAAMATVIGDQMVGQCKSPSYRWIPICNELDSFEEKVRYIIPLKSLVNALFRRHRSARKKKRAQKYMRLFFHSWHGRFFNPPKRLESFSVVWLWLMGLSDCLSLVCLFVLFIFLLFVCLSFSCLFVCLFVCLIVFLFFVCLFVWLSLSSFFVYLIVCLCVCSFYLAPPLFGTPQSSQWYWMRGRFGKENKHPIKWTWNGNSVDSGVNKICELFIMTNKLTVINNNNNNNNNNNINYDNNNINNNNNNNK